MTLKERHYRLRFATLGATVVAGNVDFVVDTLPSSSVNDIDDDQNGFLSDINDSIGGQAVEPTRGRTISEAMTFRLFESATNDEFMQHISNASGRANMLKRLVDISMSEDDGGTWTVWATSRVESIEEIEPGMWDITLLDERMRERELEAFGSALRLKTNGEPDPTNLQDVDSLHGASTTTLYPMGLHEEWGPVKGVDAAVSDAAGIEGEERMKFEVASIAGNIVQLVPVIRQNPASGARLLLRQAPTVTQFLRDDLKSGVDPDSLDTGGSAFTNTMPPSIDTSRTDGDFRHVVANIAGTNYELLGNGIFQDGGNIGRTTEEGVEPHLQRFTKVDLFVIWPTNQPSIGDEVLGYVWAPTAPASKATPHHLGGTGTNLAALAKTLYQDGNLLIDATGFDNAADRTQLVGSLRVTSPQDFSRFVEEHIWQVIGHVPVVNSSGQISPIDVRLPDADRITLSNLTVVDANDISEPLNFMHVSDEFVTKLNFEWEGVSNIADLVSAPVDEILGSDFGGDMLQTSTKTRTREHDRISEFGTTERTIKLRSVHSPQVANPLIEEISQAIFNRYGDGPVQRESTQALTSLESLTLGEFVKLNIDIAPNIATGSRGGDIVTQVLSRPLTLHGPSIRLLDGGPATAPLTTPTLALAQAPAAPKRALEATITNLPTDASYVIQIATNDTEPAATSDLWQTVATGDANETTIIGPLAGGETHWGRIQARAPGRISSAWSTPVSQNTASYTAPSGLSVILTLNGIRASWTNGEETLGVRLEIDGAFAIKLPAGMSTVDITDLQFAFSPSTTYNSPGLSVFHKDPQGGTSSSVSKSFSTGTASKAPAVCPGRAVGREELAA